MVADLEKTCQNVGLAAWRNLGVELQTNDKTSENHTNRLKWRTPSAFFVRYRHSAFPAQSPHAYRQIAEHRRELHGPKCDNPQSTAASNKGELVRVTHPLILPSDATSIKSSDELAPTSPARPFEADRPCAWPRKHSTSRPLHFGLKRKLGSLFTQVIEMILEVRVALS
jgi:hypothetical protein